MNEEGYIKLGMGALVCLLLVMVCSTIATTECVFVEEKTDVEKILNEHNFSKWSIEDKTILTEMMRQTASQNTSNDLFVSIAYAAPKHVLETYIDLLENAGY